MKEDVQGEGEGNYVIGGGGRNGVRREGEGRGRRKRVREKVEVWIVGEEWI